MGGMNLCSGHQPGQSHPPLETQSVLWGAAVVQEEQELGLSKLYPLSLACWLWDTLISISQTQVYHL